MSAYRLTKPNYEAGRAVRRLRQQLGEVKALLKESSDAPAALKAEVDSLDLQLQDLAERLDDAGSDLRGASAIGGSTSRPTEDQLWQLDQAWENIPPLIGELNDIISTQMPALYRQLDNHGIRPSPGEPVVVPRR
jgi:ABC-type transporter Mla subunit MlaD